VVVKHSHRKTRKKKSFTAIAFKIIAS